MIRTILLVLIASAVAGCAMQQQQEDATKEEVTAGFALFQQVWEGTGDPFEARRQVLAKHALLFMNNPVWSRNIDQFTALAWFAEGGEIAGAECYMRGFQFGTAHHDQCVYEVKMGRGGFPVTGAPPPASRSSQPREEWLTPPAVAGRVEQGGKVYDPSECIGPVIMGRCHGSILPNKAYHPTCHGTWLNGHCTGPMF